MNRWRSRREKVDMQPAQFVRFVLPDESWEELLDEARSETWTRRCKMAVIRLMDGRRVMVRGGRDGIEFALDATGRIMVEASGESVQVAELVWHTHLRVTGPSDWDRQVLDMLDQEASVVIEINGEPNGTTFRRKRR